MNLCDGNYITTPNLVPTAEREIAIRKGKVSILTQPFYRPAGTYIYSQKEFFAVNKLIRSL